MAYRGILQPENQCTTHASNEATATCASCLRAICDICIVYEGQNAHCPLCARRKRRSRTVLKSIGAVVLVAVAGSVAAAIGFVVSRPAPFDYGTDAPAFRKLSDQLASQPCNRATVIELTNLMVRMGNYRDALAQADGFYKQCGEFDRMRWVTYTAHLRLSQFPAAIADATVLVEHNPDDSDYPVWRGEAWEAANQLDRAAADYRLALSLRPSLTDVPLALARVYQRQGQGCRAFALLDWYATHHAVESQKNNIEARLELLKQTDQCKSSDARFGDLPPP